MKRSSTKPGSSNSSAWNGTASAAHPATSGAAIPAKRPTARTEASTTRKALGSEGASAPHEDGEHAAYTVEFLFPAGPVTVTVRADEFILAAARRQGVAL